jgi:hypothetical protein
MTITDAIHAVVLRIPETAWTPAVEPEGEIVTVPGSPSLPGMP